MSGFMARAQWDAELYDAKHAFVWEKARGLLDWLAPGNGERILDLGCGTGQLAAEIAARGAHVTGVDRSPEMVAEARKKFPALRFVVGDARALPFGEAFDAVFSNAALHWIPEALPVVQGISRALKPGGRFVAEFGGKGNVESVVAAMEYGLEALDLPRHGANPWYNPSIAEYSALLEKHGLEVRQASLFHRPTRLEDGKNGLATCQDVRRFFPQTSTASPTPGLPARGGSRRQAHSMEIRCLGARLSPPPVGRLEDGFAGSRSGRENPATICWVALYTLAPPC